MLSEGSQRWGGNEAGMRVISFQDVRNISVGQRAADDCLRVLVRCVSVIERCCLPPETGRGGLVHRSHSVSLLFQPGEEKRKIIIVFLQKHKNL